MRTPGGQQRGINQDNSRPSKQGNRYYQQRVNSHCQTNPRCNGFYQYRQDPESRDQGGQQNPKTHNIIKDASMMTHKMGIDVSTACTNNETRMLETVHIPKLVPLAIIMIDARGIFQCKKRRHTIPHSNP